MVKSTNINIDVLAKIVAQAGATIDSFESNFDKRDFHMKPMVDIVVLRFPDISNPFFKVRYLHLERSCAQLLTSIGLSHSAQSLVCLFEYHVPARGEVWNYWR